MATWHITINTHERILFVKLSVWSIFVKQDFSFSGCCNPWKLLLEESSLTRSSLGTADRTSLVWSISAYVIITSAGFWAKAWNICSVCTCREVWTLSRSKGWIIRSYSGILVQWRCLKLWLTCLMTNLLSWLYGSNRRLGRLACTDLSVWAKLWIIRSG